MKSSAAAASQSSSRSSPSAQTMKSNRHLPCGVSSPAHTGRRPSTSLVTSPWRKPRTSSPERRIDGAVGQGGGGHAPSAREPRVASQTLTIRRPDDWHVHLRDGEMLKRVAPLHRAAVRAGDRHAQPGAAGDQRRGGATLTASASWRRPVPGFTPLMTCYLTDDANPDELARGFEEGVWIAAKLYPAGRDHQQRERRHRHPQHLSGARADGDRSAWCCACTAKSPIPDVDVFDREAVFIERILIRLVRDFPGLKIVFEHITTAEAADFVTCAGSDGRRDRHAAASDHQPQRHFRRRAEAACLLPARRQAREAPASGAQGRDVGLAEILPWHRQRAACARGQGIVLRLRRHLQRAVSRSKAMRQCSRRKARSTSSRRSRRSTVPRFYGLPLNEGTVTLEAQSST